MNFGQMIKSKNFSESSFLRITFVFRELMKTKQKSQTISHHFILIRYDLYKALNDLYLNKIGSMFSQK